MSWEPIETANKDGRFMLLGLFGHEWSEEDDTWDVDMTDFHGCGCCNTFFPEPTHWMELPCFPLIDFDKEETK